LFRVFKAVGEQAGTAEYANRTVNCFFYCTICGGIFRYIYVFRTVIRVIYCTFYVPLENVVRVFYIEKHVQAIWCVFVIKSSS